MRTTWLASCRSTHLGLFHISHNEKASRRSSLLLECPSGGGSKHPVVPEYARLEILVRSEVGRGPVSPIWGSLEEFGMISSSLN